MAYASQLTKGTKVYYTRPNGSKENGIVKSVHEEHAFVVYHCDQDWKNFQNYTGASTALSSLSLGWVDDKGRILEEYCDHEFEDASYKWGPINRMRCMNCGKIID